MRIFGFTIRRVSKRAEAWADREKTLAREHANAAETAATTSLWSWREMFKYLDGDTPENLLGWKLSEALGYEIGSWGVRGAPPTLHKTKIIRPDEIYWATVLSCAEKVNDPVIKALVEFGTLRALSDTLPHLVLRQEDPTQLRWNTADYCKQVGGPDLYAINGAWTSQLREQVA